MRRHFISLMDSFSIPSQFSSLMGTGITWLLLSGTVIGLRAAGGPGGGMVCNFDPGKTDENYSISDVVCRGSRSVRLDSVKCRGTNCLQNSVIVFGVRSL